MTKQLADMPTLPPIGVSTALLASELPEAGKAAPEWIKVTPRGHTKTRDGRTYNFDPEKLVDTFKANGVDVPADLNHAIALKGAKGEAADAIGWAKELQAREDGTYARMEWLAAGSAVLAARTHRYVSPTFPHDEAGNAQWLHSIALLAAPALNMPALAAAGVGEVVDTPKPSGPPLSIASALGLDKGADETACLAAITELQASYVPVSLYADALASLNAAHTALAAQSSEKRSGAIAALMEKALSDGKIFPYERPHYEALCVTDAGFQAVSVLMTNKVGHGLFRPSRIDGAVAPAGDEPVEALAARAIRYRQAQNAAGASLSQSEAIAFCHANPTAGR